MPGGTGAPVWRRGWQVPETTGLRTGYHCHHGIRGLYFLIVWDFIKYAKDHGIPVGPGRGSAAGSLVAYSLNITDLIDPIRYNLIFERFLSPGRNDAGY